LVIITVKTDKEKVLLQSKDSQNKYSRDVEKKKDPEEAAIVLSTHGLIFFGTPFRGAPGIPLKRIRDQAVKVGLPVSDRLYKHLEPHSEWLDDQQHRFSTINQDFTTLFCYEDQDTSIGSFMKRVRVFITIF
jgi:hypothetical protein